MTTSPRSGGEGHYGARAGQRWFLSLGDLAHIELPALADESKQIPPHPLELQLHDVQARLTN